MKQQQHRISAAWVKEHISIVGLLANLGYPPPKPTGKERYYNSPLREDPTPSFCVDDRKGTWYDHGDGIGGNIIDLGKLLWKELSFPEVLEEIVRRTNSNYLLTQTEPPIRHKQAPLQEPHYHILNVQDIGPNQVITEYLQSRGIWQPAQGRLKEVYYYVEDEQKKRNNFFAAGWQNANGSWEIRSTDDFKACLGHKAISFIPGSPDSLAVFEGFMDYLSWLSENPFANESVLVLNSTALLQEGIVKAKSFSRITTYFDNDPTGRKANQAFSAALPQAIDCSTVYEGYNDYNDKIVAELGGYQLTR